VLDQDLSAHAAPSEQFHPGVQETAVPESAEPAPTAAAEAGPYADLPDEVLAEEAAQLTAWRPRRSSRPPTPPSGTPS